MFRQKLTDNVHRPKRLEPTRKCDTEPIDRRHPRINFPGASFRPFGLRHEYAFGALAEPVAVANWRGSHPPRVVEEPRQP